MKTCIELLILAFFRVSSLAAQQYVISTYAGGAPPPSPFYVGEATIGRPLGVATDNSGNVYFTGMSCVFELATNHMITLVAGNARYGYSGDNGPATSAQLANPEGVAVDASGNVYFADTDNYRIRMVSPAGIITTVAGTGFWGYSGDGGPATAAQVSFPSGVAVDSAGNLYIADWGNARVRKVSSAGIITTIAGNGSPGYSGDGGQATAAQLSNPSALAIDSAGSLYIADVGENATVRKVSAAGTITTVAGNGTAGYSGDGGPATKAQLNAPTGVSVDIYGNLWIADSSNNRVRLVNSSGIISTYAGNGTAGLLGSSGQAVDAELYDPLSVAADSVGNLYIADHENYVIRQVNSSGIITTVAGSVTNSTSLLGDGGPATGAVLTQPDAVAVDSAGNLYIADPFNNRVRKVTAAGTITTVAGANGLSGYFGDGVPATSTGLKDPGGVAVDSGGNLYIADTQDNRVRKVSAAGIITTVAGNGLPPGYSGDGGPATIAQLNYPSDIGVDAAGNLYIVDPGNYRIRKVTPAGIITTVAGTGSYGYSGDGGPAISAQIAPEHIAVDGGGNLYISDTANSRVRKVVPTGIITTIAGTGSYGFSGDGGPATSAQLASPQGIAVDANGNLYFADSASRIRKISPAGIITTIAGNGTYGYTGDGGPAVNAQLVSPWGVAVDASGNVFVADLGNNAIRRLTPSPCSYSVSPTSLEAPTAATSLALNISASDGCAWTISNLPDWIAVAGSTNGAGSESVALLVALNSGAARSAQISVAGITVTVTQSAAGPIVAPGGVVNDASYTAPVAPGSIAAIFGDFLLSAPSSATSFPAPTSLGGLSMQFGGGLLAPLFSASAGQFNGQIPWELAGLSQTTIAVIADSDTSPAQTVSLATYAPGIFAMNASGTGQGAILDSNYRLVDSGNPALAGTAIVQIYCTGLGPVTNQPATGAPSPISPLARTTAQPTVMIGGASATALFSGLAPGEVGLYQVNALVPAGASSGSAVPVQISIGGVLSNTVTIAIQ